MNSFIIRATELKNNCVNTIKNALCKKEPGVDQIVLILIIIAVAAGIIGAFYIWSKATLIPAVETQINDSIAQWFNPN